MSDWMKKLENFEAALQRLEDFVAAPAPMDRDKAGIIQAFEFTFELAWKNLQKKAEDEKLSIASPKKAFEYGIRAGHLPIEEEELWAQMLEDRNATTHTYDSEIAAEIYSRIACSYTAMIRRLLDVLKKA